MSGGQFSVVFTGDLAPEIQAAEAQRNFQQKFRLSEEKAARLFPEAFMCSKKGPRGRWRINTEMLWRIAACSANFEGRTPRQAFSENRPRRPSRKAQSWPENRRRK